MYCVMKPRAKLINRLKFGLQVITPAMAELWFAGDNTYKGCKMEFQFVLPEFKTLDDELKVYLWNPGKVNMTYDNWEVIVYK
jgi:hypothetical protein